MALRRSTDILRLDVRKSMTVLDSLFVRNDSNVYQLEAQLLDAGAVIDLTGRTVEIRFRTPDNRIISAGATVIEPTTDGKIYYLIPNNVYSVAGTIYGEYSIYEGDSRLTGSQFTATIREDIPGDDAITADDRYPILTTLIASVQGAIQTAVDTITGSWVIGGISKTLQGWIEYLDGNIVYTYNLLDDKIDEQVESLGSDISQEILDRTADDITLGNNIVYTYDLLYDRIDEDVDSLQEGINAEALSRTAVSNKAYQWRGALPTTANAHYVHDEIDNLHDGTYYCDSTACYKLGLGYRGYGAGILTKWVAYFDGQYWSMSTFFDLTIKSYIWGQYATLDGESFNPYGDDWYNINYSNNIAGGGAVGYLASAGLGGAIGSCAIAGDGFAGGMNAITEDINGDLLDAIQLGTGTNTEPRTLKVYDTVIVDANGKIVQIAEEKGVVGGIAAYDDTLKALNGVEVDTLTITAPAANTGIAQFSLNDVHYNVTAYEGDTAEQIATNIGLQTYDGWTVVVNDTQVIFTAITIGSKISPSFDGTDAGTDGYFTTVQNVGGKVDIGADGRAIQFSTADKLSLDSFGNSDIYYCKSTSIWDISGLNMTGFEVTDMIEFKIFAEALIKNGANAFRIELNADRTSTNYYLNLNGTNSNSNLINNATGITNGQWLIFKGTMKLTPSGNESTFIGMVEGTVTIRKTDNSILSKFPLTLFTKKNISSITEFGIYTSTESGIAIGSSNSITNV